MATPPPPGGPREPGVAGRTVLLLGGSGLGRGLWDRVTPHLRAAGLTVITPQLRGIDGDATPPDEVTLTHWVEDVAAALAAERGPCTVVAHSFAAYVVAGVLERQSAGALLGRVERVVMLDAVLPQPGRSWFDLQGPGAAEVMPMVAVDGATPWFTEAELDAVHPGHGMSGADVAWLAARASGQPLGTYREPAATLPVEDAGVDLVYVRCLGQYPPLADVAPTTPGWTYVELDAGHWPMVTHPAATAALVVASMVDDRGTAGGLE